MMHSNMRETATAENKDGRKHQKASCWLEPASASDSFPTAARRRAQDLRNQEILERQMIDFEQQSRYEEYVIGEVDRHIREVLGENQFDSLAMVLGALSSTCRRTALASTPACAIAESRCLTTVAFRLTNLTLRYRFTLPNWHLLDQFQDVLFQKTQMLQAVADHSAIVVISCDALARRLRLQSSFVIRTVMIEAHVSAYGETCKTGVALIRFSVPLTP